MTAVLVLETYAVASGSIGAWIVTEAGGDEAVRCSEMSPDLALVDIHLLDCPTGIEVACVAPEETDAAVLFMTANRA